MGNAHLSSKKNNEITFSIDDKKFAVNIGELLIEVDDTKHKQSVEDSTTSVKEESGTVASSSDAVKEEILSSPAKLLAENNHYRQPNINYRPLNNLNSINGSYLDNLEDKFMINTYSDKKLKFIITSDDQFKEIFFEKYPMMKKIDYTNLFVAGGCISSILIGHKNKGDIDLFLHGCNEKEAEKVIGDNLFILSNWADEQKYDYKIYKGMHLIKFEIYDSAEHMIYEIQFIFRLYENPAEVIYGFDIGSSSVGFNGKRVLMTPLASYCYENMVNVVDSWRRSPTFGNRLYKYAQRGFKPLFPFMDVEKLNALETSIFSFSDFTIKKINDGLSSTTGLWKFAKKPSVVWNSYSKAVLTENVINANVRIPYTSKEMKRFIASYTGHCTDIWYTPKLRKNLINKIKQLYFHNITPELMSKSLNTACRYLGAENVGDYALTMHSLASYDEKKKKCAQLREQCYQKMEERVEEYHKGFKVHEGITWKTKNPAEPISSNLAYTGVAPEKWYSGNVAEKYTPMYEGKHYQKIYDPDNLHSEPHYDDYIWKDATYEEAGLPKHHSIINDSTLAAFNKWEEFVTKKYSGSSTSTSITTSTEVEEEGQSGDDDIVLV